MKFPYAVKYNGVYYPPNTEIVENPVEMWKPLPQRWKTRWKMWKSLKPVASGVRQNDHGTADRIETAA